MNFSSTNFQTFHYRNTLLYAGNCNGPTFKCRYALRSNSSQQCISSIRVQVSSTTAVRFCFYNKTCLLEMLSHEFITIGRYFDVYQLSRFRFRIFLLVCSIYNSKQLTGLKLSVNGVEHRFTISVLLTPCDNVLTPCHPWNFRFSPDFFSELFSHPKFSKTSLPTRDNFQLCDLWTESHKTIFYH